MPEHRTPTELIQMYWDRIWNQRETELIREICADPIVRHDPRSTATLTHDEQIARVSHWAVSIEPHFTHEVLHGDDRYVTSVWNMVSRKGPSMELSGIEVFRADNGRFTDCWNSTYMQGLWGRVGQEAVAPLPLELLTSIDSITADWLQRVLLDAGLKVPHVALIEAERIGSGNLSATARVNIGYNAAAKADAPVSVFCKFNSPLQQAQDQTVATGAVLREVSAYDFFPAEPVLHMPRAYLAKSDAQGAIYNMVLEDLSQSTRPGDQVTGCSVGEAAAVVEELGKLHRAYWKSPVLAEQAWALRRGAMADLLHRQYQSAAMEIRRRYAGRMSRSALETIDAFAPLVGRWTALETACPTLLHGDARVDNVLFGDKGGHPLAYLIDWQFTSVGDAMLDVAYFLTGSLSPDDRRRCERDLIARHTGYIREIDPTYTLEMALEAYRLNAVAGLQFAIIAVLAMPVGGRGDDVLIALAERTTAAVRDWDALTAINAAIA